MSRRRQQRKRKASQPQKTAPWQGWLLKGGLAVLCLLIALLIGSYFWVKSYLRSEEFRAMLSQQLGQAIGGEAEISSLDWQGSHVESEEISLKSRRFGQWANEGVEAELDLSGLWERTWRIPSIEIQKARSEWDFRKTPSAPASQSPKTASKNPAGKGNSGGRFLPNRTELLALEIANFEGEIATESGGYLWDRMDTRYEPGAGNQGGVFTLRGGRLETPLEWLGRMKLGEAGVRARPERVDLVESDWRIFERGQLEMFGHWENGGYLLEGEVEDLTVADLLSVNWQKKLTGEIEGDFVIEGSATEDLAVHGSVMMSEGAVGSLAFLDRLAAYAGSSGLRRLTFEEARSDFHWQADGWELTNLVLSDEGLIRLEGRLRVVGDSLDGSFRVAVPPGLLAHIPGAEEKVFLPGERGMLWTPLRVTGTLKNPKEDLSGRMIQAAGERMFELIPETGQWALKFGGQAMDQGTALLLENQGIILEEGAEVVEEVIEQGSDVVEEGVKTGFGILNGILGE